MFGLLEVSLLAVFILLMILVSTRSYREAKEQVEQMTEQPKTGVIICRSECIESQLYVWNVEDNTFIGQGKSVEDIIELFIEKYPHTSMRFDVKQK